MSTHTCSYCDSPGDGNCSACRGTGKSDGNGTSDALNASGLASSCSACGGTGECQKCGGSGETEVGGEG
jgi:hypothetical protein